MKKGVYLVVGIILTILSLYLFSYVLINKGEDNLPWIFILIPILLNGITYLFYGFEKFRIENYSNFSLGINFFNLIVLIGVGLSFFINSLGFEILLAIPLMMLFLTSPASLILIIISMFRNKK